MCFCVCALGSSVHPVSSTGSCDSRRSWRNIDMANPVVLLRINVGDRFSKGFVFLAPVTRFYWTVYRIDLIVELGFEYDNIMNNGFYYVILHYTKHHNILDLRSPASNIHIDGIILICCVIIVQLIIVLTTRQHRLETHAIYLRGTIVSLCVKLRLESGRLRCVYSIPQNRKNRIIGRYCRIQ